ncbi:MAG: precorrin-6A synthase (deacetylating) [Micromonosporaceae bacterium]|nr:precorrin-6A synthase (deacetylating) [Micromonosporaceae bacterium]
MTRHVRVVGIGAGDPDDLTLKAVAAIRSADLFFLLEKGSEKQDLAGLRRRILNRHARPPYRVVEIDDPVRDRTSPAYVDAVADWRRRRADRYEQVIRDEVPPGGSGAFLVWGDPALYDSTIAVLHEVTARGAIAIDYTVVPGISSVASLAAAHRLSLTRVGRPVQITTGRRLAEEGMPPGVGDVVVMLDARCAFTEIAGDRTDIFWGAYLGTPDEILVAGPVTQVADQIVVARAEARRRKGWIMDVYLLRTR